MATRISNSSFESRDDLPRLVSCIATALEKVVQRNERASSSTSDVVSAVFHGSKPPSLSIRQYLERVFKYAKCSTSCFVVAYIYLERFCGCLTPLNVHRLVITSVMVAAKFLDDECYNNAYYARIGGVSTEEMNRMEMKFLFSLDFRLNVTVESYISYCSKLEREERGRDRYPVLLPTMLESRQPPPRRLVSTVGR
ncbi:CYCU4-2 [Linum perenne]